MRSGNTGDVRLATSSWHRAGKDTGRSCSGGLRRQKSYEGNESE